MKKVIVLGSTGSIGLNALRVIDDLPDDLSVAGLAVNKDYEGVLAQAAKYGVKHVAVSDPESATKCVESAPDGVTVHSGEKGLEALSTIDDANLVLCSVVGTAGLKPVLAALEGGRDVALATKEVLVAGGHIVTEACRKSGAKLIPVDSEHGAILQCIAGCRGQRSEVSDQMSEVRKLVLTASGGPFYSQKDLDLGTVTVEQALNHPNWDMGKKVTIDSATLMNKGLEIIEAKWIFGMDIKNIDVVVHPESIVHSMVEFVDGSTLAQMSVPDMRYAIQYALTYPERMNGNLAGMDFSAISQLNFEEVDMSRFPALGLAREAGECGGTMPAVMNAANESAVQMFLDGAIYFPGIWETVECVMRKHKVIEKPGLDEVLDADSWARAIAFE
jgi:1-deoxy-D-xylulose-5-phosphate reductoisomerase